jgi:isopentenyl-diphosphate delta-isomerase type 1
MSQTEYVILVDEKNNEVGREEKLEAHRTAQLHRAFSVFLYRMREEHFQILLQQREKSKYHCGGLWANTCCSHPRLGEEVVVAGNRRLREEVGIDLEPPLVDVGWFHYKAEFENGLTEHEIDHVLIAPFDKETGEIAFNPEEVEALRWLSLEEIEEDLERSPGKYAPWFPLALEMAKENAFDKLDKSAAAG